MSLSIAKQATELIISVVRGDEGGLEEAKISGFVSLGNGGMSRTGDVDLKSRSRLWIVNSKGREGKVL